MSSDNGSSQGDGATRQSAVWIDPDAAPGEVRISDSRVVGGGAKVSAFTEEPPDRIDSSREAADGGEETLDARFR